MHGEVMQTAQLAEALNDLEDRFIWDVRRMLPQATEMLYRARELGDELLIARAELARANLQMRAGDLASAAQRIPKIHQRATELNSPALLARTHLVWATIYGHLGDTPNLLDHAVLSVTLLDDSASEHMQIWHRTKLGDALSLNGSMGEARVYYEKAVELALKKDQPHLAMAVLNNRADAECGAGAGETAREVCDRMRDLADRNGFELDAAMLDTIGMAEIENQEYAQAERTLLACLDRHASTPHDDADALPGYLLTLARAQRGLGAYERAQENLDASHRLCVAGSLGAFLVRVYQEQAQLHAARGDFAQAFAAQEAFFEAYVAMGSQQDEARARTRHAMLETTEARQDADRFREQARRDPLTGLQNRRYVDECLDDLIGSSRRLTVALADLDYFKRVNDLFSHDVGDQVLVQVGHLMQDLTAQAPGAFAARLGGEEFLLVLPDLLPEQALHLTEQLRRAVESHTWSTVATGLNVTISLGVAWVSGDETGTTQRRLLSLADQHLYAAKNTGRNRVVHTLPASNPG